MTNYNHGVDSLTLQTGVRPIRTVKSSVIAVIGTAPIGPVGTQTLVLSDKQGAAFGPAFSGFSIPQALNAIFDQGAGAVIVINVLDPSGTHKTTITAESKTLDANDVATGTYPAWTGNPTVTNTAGSTTYVKDTDYTVDLVYGKIKRKSTGAMTAGQSVKLTYVYADPSKVINTDIVGTVNGSGVRTGMQALLDSFNLFGYFAKIIVAPGYSTLNSVATEMVAIAEKLRAIALLDAPTGTTATQAITGRGPNGAINFNYSSDRAALCFPHLKCMDAITGQERLEAFSPRLAGVIARTDNELGYWFSPSNKEISGITGVETSLTNEEILPLNEAGIITYRNTFGSGILSWGNRSAAWPTITAPVNFISVRRTVDIFHESLELSVMQFVDLPITNPWIDSVLNSVNAKIRSMIGQGALVDGICRYDPTLNPPSEIALGHVRFSNSIMPPVPAEWITFETFIDINLLSKLGINNG